MNRLLPCALFVLSASIARPDDAVNKLVAGHDQALQSACLPVHRKLLTELQKLEVQYTKSARKIPLAETRTEIERVKQAIERASQPIPAGTGPKPSEFKLIYTSNGEFVRGSWENGEFKSAPRGFSWTNKGPQVAAIYDKVLTGAFEAEFTWKGIVFTQALCEADYSKHIQFYNPRPSTDDKHTLKVKRTAAGAISAELDGSPFTYQVMEGARQDMYIRFLFYISKDNTVEFQNVSIKDLSVKK